MKPSDGVESQSKLSIGETVRTGAVGGGGALLGCPPISNFTPASHVIRGSRQRITCVVQRITSLNQSGDVLRHIGDVIRGIGVQGDVIRGVGDVIRGRPGT